MYHHGAIDVGHVRVPNLQNPACVATSRPVYPWGATWCAFRSSESVVGTSTSELATLATLINLKASQHASS